MKSLYLFIPLLLLSCQMRPPQPQSVNSTVASVQPNQVWVTGYYPNWANWPPPKYIQWSTWTHIIHFCIQPSAVRNPDPLHPEQVYFTLQNGRAVFESIQRQLIDSTHAHGRKIMLCLGGAGGSFINWEKLYNLSPDSLKLCLSSQIAYAKSRGYDGVDIDWEWPGSTSEGVIWNFFIKSIRDTLNTWNPPGLLSNAWFQWVGQLSSNIDWNLMNSAIDQNNIMCYDMEYGQRNVAHAPLYPPNCSLLNPGIGYGTVGDNISELVHQYTLKGLSKSKIGIGIPFYGYQHNGSSSAYCTANGGGSQVKYGQTIYPAYQGVNASRYTFDPVTQTPYLSWTDSAGHFISFDDSNSINAKVLWGKSQGLGGFMVWEMDQDKFFTDANNNPVQGLLTTALGRAVGLIPIDTIKPPPITCDTLGAYTRGYTIGFIAGKTSVICPPQLPQLNVDSIAAFWWNAALAQVPDSVDVPRKLPIMKPAKK